MKMDIRRYGSIEKFGGWEIATDFRESARQTVNNVRVRFAE